MNKVKPVTIIQTAIISAFTIATALIWKEVIVDFIQLVVPPSQELVYKFIAAVFSTAIVIIAIYVIVKTETEAEQAIKRFRQRNKK